jgi:hypothetical protein
MSRAAYDPLFMSLKHSRSEDLHAGRTSSQERLRLLDPVSHSSPPAPSADFSPRPQAPSPSQFALTRENLRHWELSQSPTHAGSWLPLPFDTSMATPSESRNSSPTRATAAKIDPEMRLNAYGITTNGKNPIPLNLQKHITEVVKAAREAVTPSAARIAKKQPRARGMGEKAAIDLLCADLLFEGEAEDEEEMIHSVPEVNLNRAYLPLAPDMTVTADVGKLTQPRPDTVIAYITSQAAELADVKPALLLDEERALAKVPLSGKLHFPFLTCQWKSQSGSETHYHASLQGARDGATIVRYLYEFYASTGCSPSNIDTCHFSITCDTLTAILFVHWRQINPADGSSIQYCMKKIAQAFLDPMDGDEQLTNMRKYMRNILDFAVTTRLNKIKAAIQVRKGQSMENLLRRRNPLSKSSKSSDVVTGESVLGIGDAVNDAPHLPPPLTPTSPASPCPTSKRPREE